MKMNARIYAFKEEKAATYLKNEGVIFMINGQAHGNLPKSIFSRPKAVGLPRLKDSLLVLMDCSSLTAVQREDLFMSSRDRLSKNPVRFDLEREIELMLRNSTELRKLQQERRERDVESQLSEEKPLEEVLGRVLKASPTLKMLFLKGQRLSRPFAGGGAKEGEADGRKRGPGEMFKGARHPHYFRVAKHEYGKVYRRNCEEGRRCRIKFETDAENGYFDRATDRGTFELQVIDAAREMSEPSYSLTLEEGEAHLNMALPPEAEVGDHVVVQATVNDPVLFEPFVNVICLTVLRKQKHTTSDGPSPRRPTKRGSGDDPAKEGIALPKIVSVKESDEHWRKHKFTVEDGCHVITEPVTEDGKEQLAHTFYVNVDNAALKTEMKYTKQDPRLLEAKFKYGVVLLGLGMLHDQYRSNGDTVGDTDEISVEDNIRNFTRAISTVLLPVIDQLSGLDEASLAELSEAGEDD